MEIDELTRQAVDYYRGLQDRICAALEEADGGARFREDPWTREGGGGGRSRVLVEGDLFEKAGVGFSEVHGELAPELARSMPMGDGTRFFAAGVSLVLHPRSPMVPTVHANFRCIQRGAASWLGGGADLTPSYPFEDDCRHFHGTFRRAIDAHDPALYPRWKKTCDEYFSLPHRGGEMRGIGGIFFDYLPADARAFELQRAAGEAFLPSYLPICDRRRALPWGERERSFQLWRRGRYVEFNLLHDRGTVFGLKTGGRTESILMSLPPLVRWGYAETFEPGTREAEALEFLRPRDWA